jgi:hypothetical protein
MFKEDRVEMLFFGEDILDVERLRARISEFFFVWEGARFGMTGASSRGNSLP